MLDPADRETLVEALRPPPGMRLDAAVATTFTLDLEALLAVPLALSLGDVATARSQEDSDRAGDGEPVALLHALRDHAERVTVFCRAGAIGVPRAGRPVMAWLEDAVIAVEAPHPGGIFHPKIWVLRFTGPDDTPALVRVLCGSRNLTFDRAWDTLIWTEGYTDDGDRHGGGAHELAALLDWLPEAALTPLTDDRREAVARLAGDLRRVRLAAPEGSDALTFHVLGLPGQGSARLLSGRHDAALVVSPFLGAETVRRVAGLADRAAVISRPEALADVGSSGCLEGVETFTLSPDLDTADGDADPSRSHGVLVGLHAKLYALDSGARTRVLMGSANATAAAWSMNVEVLCELTGQAETIGVRALLSDTADGDMPAFRRLLEEYAVDPSVPPEPPDAQEGLRWRVGALAAAVARRGVAARVEAADVDDGRPAHTLAVELDALPHDLLAGLAVRCRPITLAGDVHGRQVVAGEPLRALFPVGVEGITAFVAFDVDSTDDRGLHGEGFVVKARLHDAPSDRRERVLAALLRGPDRFVRYLMLLLGVEDPAGGAGTGTASGIWRGTSSLAGGTPLLELLLRAAARSPERLDEIARLVSDLRAAGDTTLPERFLDVWEPVWACREQRG